MAFVTSMRLPASTLRPDLGARARAQPRAVVCASARAQSDQASRRAAIAGVLSVPLLFAARDSMAAFITLDDSRNSGAKQVIESMDQARDDKEDQRKRFSFETFEGNQLVDHQKRAKESFNRLQRDVKQLLDKKEFPKVSRETRNQMGTLRYDLQRINGAGDKNARKAATAEYKQAIKALEELDLYARLGKASEANEAYSEAVAKLGNIVKAYG